MPDIYLYLAVGAFAGVLAGLFGVGGGLVIVPVLAFAFARAGIAPEVLMHLAIGSSLATIVFTSLASVRAHHRRGAVQWRLVGRLAPGIVVGALLGAMIADWLPGTGLRRIFGIFELAVAVQLGLGLKPAPHRTLPGTPGLFAAGGVIGTVSAIVGIGGGTLTVPFLTWNNVAIRNAVATSAACGMPIALAGAIGFAAAGWGESALPAASTGYLYWPAIGGVVAASMLFAPLGARLAHTLPGDVLKRLFALFLAGLGVYMLI
ncbi:sulfite exporter TauE/SafE family protein [Thiohalomonas denitrificans]|uniref:sulfite exporter TauE/SafE family protein n=1 Tax=Thiohalomonas denitrificans TaxID=415747 RepID=UPI0026F22D23|nr:sulfite exporter TauE/SafE family protein [Thiohalomonas denitrificans]